MMRLEPPTKEAAITLFNNLSMPKDMISAVGRMKFNKRLGIEELEGDIQVMKIF